MTAADEPQYELAMPFVTVTSVGGPHDDASYSAGFEMGALDIVLRDLAGPVCIARSWETTITTDNVPQADLIGMKHGYTMRIQNSDVVGWTHAHFTKEDPS